MPKRAQTSSGIVVLERTGSNLLAYLLPPGTPVEGRDSFITIDPESVADIRATVLVNTYDVLDHPLTLRVIKHSTLVVLPPRSLHQTANDPLQVWQEWNEGIVPNAEVDEHVLKLSVPYLQERRRAAEKLCELGQRISGQVRGISHDYADIATQDSTLNPMFLPVLRRFPSPRMIRATNPVNVKRLLRGGTYFSRAQALEQLLRLSPTAVNGGDESHCVELMEFIVPELIDEYELLTSRIERLDHEVFRILSHEIRPPFDDHSFHAFDTLPTSKRVPHQKRVTETDAVEFEAIANKTWRTIEHLYADPREVKADYETLLTLQNELRLNTDDSHEVLQFRINIGLALLAVTLGDVPAAERLSAETEELRRRDFLRPEPVIPRQLFADGTIITALVDAAATDTVVGFAGLQTAYERGIMEDASAAIAAEGLGVITFLTALVGEAPALEPVMRELHARISDNPDVRGSARAPYALTRLLTLGSMVDVPNSMVEAARAEAEVTSRGTVYRSFYNYICMLTSYMTRDTERALACYREIQVDGHWKRFDPRFDRMARLSYATCLASQGKFAAVRAEIAHMTFSSASDEAYPDVIMRDLLLRRLDLAIGLTKQALDDTSPSGALWEHRLQSTHPRYVPAALVVRGTALYIDGAKDAASDLFRAATASAVRRHAFLALLATETHEYRDWLQSLDGLDPKDLPDGLTPEMLSQLLQRPILIDKVLTPLTQQQHRVLEYLTLGKTVAAIASQMRVSVNTVKSHLHQLYRRLGVNSRDQAVMVAEEYGITG